MGFHLIDQAACLAAGQPTVRGCIVPNGGGTPWVNSGRGWTCVATAATCFWVACMAYPPQRQINGLQRCNSLLCGCQILQGKAVHRLIGRQHGFAAAQAVERLHVQAGWGRGWCCATPWPVRCARLRIEWADRGLGWIVLCVLGELQLFRTVKA